MIDTADQRKKMIVYESFLTIFVLSVNFWGTWDNRNKNRLEPKPEPPVQNSTNLSLPESVKHIV